MKTLLLKEFREQTPLGALAVLAWMAWWGFVPPIGNRLQPSGDGIVGIAFASIVMGLALGFAPFEIERQGGMRTFLVHRGVRARAVALARIAIAGAWAAGIVLAGLAVVTLVQLRPALVVPGYVERTLRALATAGAIVWPALGAGALAGCLGERAWVRWTGLLLMGAGLAFWGAEASRSHVLQSAAGTAPYLAFCALVSCAAVGLAVRRFEAEVHEDRGPAPGLRLASACLGLLLWTPTFLFTAQVLEHASRVSAWSSNAYWLRSVEGAILQRPNINPPPAFRFIFVRPYFAVDFRTGDQLLFHPIAGSTRYWDKMLGYRPHWQSHVPWAIGMQEDGPSYFRSWDGGQGWIDAASDRIVTFQRDGRGRPVVETLALPGAEPGLLASCTLESARSSRDDGIALIVDISRDVRGVVILGHGDADCRTLSFPGGEPMIEVTRGRDVVVEGGLEARSIGESTVFVGPSASYVFDGDKFRRVLRFEPPPMPSIEDSPDVEAVVSGYDGLAYTVTLRDGRDGALLGSSRIAPRTPLERASACMAMATTLTRLPVESIASFALHPSDDDGSGTPSQSTWIDPLVLGGRRPWLVALHLAVGAALAWSARRRLGGQGWAWPLAVALLGLPAWIACRLLEPRRAPAPEGVRPAPMPHWAPIVDRATA